MPSLSEVSVMSPSELDAVIDDCIVHDRGAYRQAFCFPDEGFVIKREYLSDDEGNDIGKPFTSMTAEEECYWLANAHEYLLWNYLSRKNSKLCKYLAPVHHYVTSVSETEITAYLIQDYCGRISSADAGKKFKLPMMNDLHAGNMGMLGDMVKLFDYQHFYPHFLREHLRVLNFRVYNAAGYPPSGFEDIDQYSGIACRKGQADRLYKGAEFSPGIDESPASDLVAKAAALGIVLPARHGVVCRCGS